MNTALSNPSSSLADPRFAALLEELANKCLAGEPLDWQAYERDYPEHVEELRQLMPAMHAVADLSRSAQTPGAPSASTGEPVTGVLGDFRIVREVGRGGMGVVYEAEQISLGRRVALKVLPLAATMDARHLQRFKNEAQAAAYLTHQNIVPVYYVGCDRGVHYYAMQFIDGHSLAEVIDQLRQERGEAEDPAATEAYCPGAPALIFGADGKLRPVGAEATPVERLDTRPGSATPGSGLSRPAYFAWVARLGEQAALALEHAHQQGVLHRDIKPANLMLDSRGNVWITDFGLAHLPGDQRLTMTGDLLGTLRYMSPEQALAQRVTVDQRTDIYSLGVTLYELLTLQPAYAGHDRQDLLSQIAFKEPKPPRKLDKAIPPELETIVLKAMEKVPGDRYSTAQELAEDIHRYLADEPIRARRPSVVRRLRKWGRRHKAAVTAAVVLLAVAVAGLSIGSWALWLEKRRANEGWSRAEERLAFSYQILDELWMDMAENQLSHKASLTSEDRQFLERMRTLYEKVAEQGGDTPVTRLRTARAFERIGNVQVLLGEYSQAVEAYDGAIQRLDGLLAEDPESRECRSELAMAHFRKGSCLAQPWGSMFESPQRVDRAPVPHQQAPTTRDPVPEYRAAAHLFQELAHENSAGNDHVLDWAKCEYALSDFAATVAESLALLRHAESLLTHVQFAEPARRDEGRRTLALCERNLARYVTTYDEKVVKYRQAIRLFEELHAGAPDNFNLLWNLQASRLALAQFLASHPAQGPGDKANRKAVVELTQLTITGLDKYARMLPAVPSRLWCVRTNLGLLLTEEGNWPEAERQYKLALESARKLEAEHPQTVLGHHATGCVLDNLACLYLDSAEHRDPAKALPYAQEAVKHQPDNVEFQNTLGEAYFRAGQYRTAVPLLLEYPASGFLYADPWFLLSMTHWKLGEKAQARCWYRLAEDYVAVQKPPTAKQRALQDEAAALLGMSRPPKPTDDAESTRDFQEMCRHAPAAPLRSITRPFDRYEPLIYANALNTLAWTCVTSPEVSLRDPERAVRLAQYATMLMPKEANYMNTLGVAHYRAGHWKEAIAALTRSMELEKGALEAFDTFFLAMAHWRLGEKEKARQWYQRAVQWTETHRYQSQDNEEWLEELQRFRAEAAKLLGITNSSRPPGPAQEAGK